MDLISDQAYESLSEHSSRITSSNRLSTSSLSGSSLTTHSSSTNNNNSNKFVNSSNNRNCSHCNKKIRKRKTFRQNAVEIDSGIGRSNRSCKSSNRTRNCQSAHISDELNSSPSTVQLPPGGGSQTTLTPDLTLVDSAAQFASLKFASTPSNTNLCRRCKSISSSIPQNYNVYSSSHSNSVSSSNNICNKESSNSTNNNNINNNSSSKSKDTSLLTMIKSTFTKLFEIKQTTKTSSSNKQSKNQQQQQQQHHSTEYNNSRFSSNRTSNCSRSSSRKRSSGSGGQSISYCSVSGQMLETGDDLSILTSGIITSTPTSTPPPISQYHPNNATVSFQQSPPTPFSSLPLDSNNSSSDSSLVAVKITNASITPQIPCFQKCRHREYHDDEYEDDEDDDCDDDDDDEGDDCDDYDDDDDDDEGDEADDDVLDDYMQQYPYFYSHHSYQQHRYSLTVPTLLDYERLNKKNPRMYGCIKSGRVILESIGCSGNVPAIPNSLVIGRKPVLHKTVHIKSKSLSSQYGRGVSSVNTAFTKTNRLLCASWPPAGLHLCLHEDESSNKELGSFDIDGYDFTDNDFESLIGRTDKTVRNIYEFNIPYSDIRLGELVKSGPKKKIHRGHWHGEVMVFIFKNLNKERDLSKFWEKVSSLTMIRHENIVLFMGASVEPHFLMVTSSCNGPSLYEKIHMSREKMRQSFKVNLLRQIAQAVGYLHARSKPVIVSTLNSRNIYMEPKVVLCLLDYSNLEQDDIDTLDTISIPQHLVWYTAPELLQSVNHRKQDFPFSLPSSSFVQATDVYSFGTLLYEIHMGRYPRSKPEAKEFVEDACNGRRPDIKEMRASETVKNIIQECWSHDPLGRPEFSDISRELMKRNATRKRHSSSVPDHLNRDIHSYHF